MNQPLSFTPFDLQQVDACVNFANTVHWHASEHPEETLHTYADLVKWACEQGMVGTKEAKALIEMGSQHPRHAAESLQRAVDLREVIYRVLTAQVHGHYPSQADLDQVNGVVSESLMKLRLVATSDGFQWGWILDEISLDQLLGPIALTAVALLTSKELLSRVGQCADDRGCGWLFLDRSKNHSRQWCDINDCGNRAKQKRYYERKQQK